MNTHTPHTELLDAYLDNTMDAETRANFEQNLRQNKALQQVLEAHRVFKNNLHRAFFKETLNNIHNQKINNTRFLYKKYWAVAASVILMVGLSVWRSIQPSRNNQLFKQYFYEDPGLPTVMGETAHFTFDNAMIDYKQNKYDLALTSWKQLLNIKPENDTLQYYIGMCYLNKKQWKKAKLLLNKKEVIQSKTFSKQAYFYLGLIALKQNKTEEAKQLFLKANPVKVKKLLNEMDN